MRRFAVMFSGDAASARLTARPAAPKPRAGTSSIGIGVHDLKLSNSRREGVVFVPTAYNPARPTPLLLTLHGAGASGVNGLHALLGIAEQQGIILLAPDSKGSTWDFLRGGFGPDVEYIDKALQNCFTKYNVDPHRICCSGFSDGASYALTLGLTNGDLFSHIVAYSPGFMRPVAFRGKPLIYVSHGDDDRVLDVDRCSRRIVQQLKSRGYQMQYHEFEGGHTVPPTIASEGVDFFLQSYKDMGRAREG